MYIIFNVNGDRKTNGKGKWTNMFQKKASSPSLGN